MTTSKVTKDFIAFRKYIRSKELSVNEQYLLELLFEYHNSDLGYAYPTVQTLMEAFNTSSKPRVILTIKKLEKKGLITVERKKRSNNKYFVTDIANFINDSASNSDSEADSTQPKDTTESVQATEIEAVEPQAEETGKVKTVINRFKGLFLSEQQKAVINSTPFDVLEKALNSIKVNNVNGTYILGAIERATKNVTSFFTGNSQHIGFNNFTPREYDYDALEKKLLGWA